MKPNEGPANRLKNLVALVEETEKGGIWTPEGIQTTISEEGVAKRISYKGATLNVYGDARYRGAHNDYVFDWLRVESARNGLRLTAGDLAAARRILECLDYTRGAVPVHILDDGTFSIELKDTLLGNSQIFTKAAKTVQKAGAALRDFIEYDAEQRVAAYFAEKKREPI